MVYGHRPYQISRDIYACAYIWQRAGGDRAFQKNGGDDFWYKGIGNYTIKRLYEYFSASAVDLLGLKINQFDRFRRTADIADRSRGRRNWADFGRSFGGNPEQRDETGALKGLGSKIGRVLVLLADRALPRQSRSNRKCSR
jgi:hypothetical protein